MATYKSDGLRISTYTNGDTAIVAYRTAGSFITNSNTITPGKPEVNKPDAASLSAPWSYEEPQPNIEKGYGQDGLPYIFKCEGLKKTTGGTVTYTWLEPTLYKAWNNMDIDATEYAQFVEQTYYFTSDALAWIKPDGEESAKLYIKASEILVNDTNQKKLFEAGGNKVYIAGWNVDSHCIYQMKIIDSEKIYDNGAFIQNLYYLDGDNYTLATSIQNNVQYFIVHYGGHMLISYFEKHSQSGDITIVEPSLVGEDNQSAYYAIYAIGTGLQEPNSGAIAFSVGFTNWDDWSTGNCYITHDGYLHAKNATIQGYINATSGYIGDWSIVDGVMSVNVGESVYWRAANLSMGTSGIKFTTDDKNITTIFANNYLDFTDLNSRYNLVLDAGGLSLTAMTNSDLTSVCAFGFCNGSRPLPPGSDYTNAYLGKFGSVSKNYFIGFWESQYTIPVFSDIRYKNSVVNFDEKYEIFFDQIQPRIYNLNFNSSQKHYGFIAQEILAGLQFSGIDPAECGLVPTRDNEEQYYALSYQEFIPLNTWQIQKLKPRMTAAEEKISQLELEISSLKSELANLKKS